METKLFVFDLDGVILDSEPLHTRAHEILYNEIMPGTPLPSANIAGLSAADYYVNLLTGHYGKPPTDEEVQDWRRRHFETLLGLVVQGEVPAMDGLQQLLDALEKKGYQIGLASSSDRGFVTGVLYHLGIQNYFSCVACGDDEGVRYKPAPDIYLKLLEQAGVSPALAMALEDSSPGLRAAIAAGIRCLAYANPLSGKQDFTGAYAVVNNMAEVIPYL